MADLPIRTLDAVPALTHGAHPSSGDGMCAMEAVAWLAGEPHSDAPTCACPAIAAFVRAWNDALPDEDRDRLLRPLLARLIGSRATPKIETRRALMAADWLVREHTPAWLRLAGLTPQADALAGLPEIIDMAQVPSIRAPIEAARRDAEAAGDAAWAAAGDTAWAAARDAAWAAARAAAWAAAWAAARDAAWDAAGHAAWAAARDAAWAAARDAAWDAAWDAARDALRPTVAALQASAAALIVRMIEVRR